MSKGAKKESNSNVVEIDKLLTEKNNELDYDLTDSMDDHNGGTETLDIHLGDADFNPEVVDPVKYSQNKSLVTRQSSDITINASKKNLEKMEDYELLSVQDFQEKRIVHPEMEKFEILNAFREIRTKILQESWLSQKMNIPKPQYQINLGTELYKKPIWRSSPAR